MPIERMLSKVYTYVVADAAARSTGPCVIYIICKTSFEKRIYSYAVQFMFTDDLVAGYLFPCDASGQ